MGKKIKVENGDIYGNITILYEVDSKYGSIRRFATKCVKCGKVAEMNYNSIVNSKTGCRCTRVPKNVRIKPYKVYRYEENRLKNVYAQIKYRCYNVNSPAYQNYGLRGIKNEWNDFEEFYESMSNTFMPGLTLDRLNNNGNYSKDNCKWVTRKKNNRNKRNNVIIRGKCLSEFCEENRLDRNLIQGRLRLGWDIEEAINTPRRYRSRNRN